MGKNFIEKLFYFLDRPLPPTREHEWELHMVSLGPNVNRRGRGIDRKGTRRYRSSSSTANRSNSSLQRIDTSTNHTRFSNRSHRRRRSQTTTTAARGNRRGTSRRSRLPVVVGNGDNRRGRIGNRRGRAFDGEVTAGDVRSTRTVVVYLLLVPLWILLGLSRRSRRVGTTPGPPPWSHRNRGPAFVGEGVSSLCTVAVHFVRRPGPSPSKGAERAPHHRP
jgi:hypothetical protein